MPEKLAIPLLDDVASSAERVIAPAPLVMSSPSPAVKVAASNTPDEVSPINN